MQYRTILVYPFLYDFAAGNTSVTYLARAQHSEILTLHMSEFWQPKDSFHQKKFSAAKDPCSIVWDVLWDDLVTMELTHGKKDQPSAPPSRVVLYLQTKSIEMKDQVRIVKCNRDSNQAFKVYAAIEQAMSTYGPNKSKVRINSFLVALLSHYSSFSLSFVF